ncbi:Protein CBG09385 [Caenorhabditis briggsae]|uniref:Protein CBG09385 n=1 Tax=Caenorhabditis briggsae TaxID=6238 RepID=A8X977_CAEBR|nr:Protein CBG09385 [Caenorhabditis briggsae]CAP29189.2 Protein CBG09385 [Caenorhabditis briggsae]
MPTTFAPVIGLSESIATQTCNCHYPIGLVIFLIFTIASLLVCICVCCFDLGQVISLDLGYRLDYLIFQCNICQRDSRKEVKFRRTSMNARFVEPSKFVIDRKLSMDPCLMEYRQLFNSGSVTSSSNSHSRCIENPQFSFSTERSLISTV